MAAIISKNIAITCAHNLCIKFKDSPPKFVKKENLYIYTFN